MLFFCIMIPQNYHTLDPKQVDSASTDGFSLARYLRDNQLVISVYDGNSLILLGTVHVPLHVRKGDALMLNIADLLFSSPPASLT